MGALASAGALWVIMRPTMRRRFRIFTASRLVDVAWALRWLCKPCSQHLLATARRLVPGAERYFIRRS